MEECIDGVVPTTNTTYQQIHADSARVKVLAESVPARPSRVPSSTPADDRSGRNLLAMDRDLLLLSHSQLKNK
jgi:hypothetical protein